MNRRHPLLFLPLAFLGTGALFCLWVVLANSDQLRTTSRWYGLALTSLGLFVAGLVIGVLSAPARSPQKAADPPPPPPPPPAPPRPPIAPTPPQSCDWDAELAHLLEDLGL